MESESDTITVLYSKKYIDTTTYTPPLVLVHSFATRKIQQNLFCSKSYTRFVINQMLSYQTFPFTQQFTRAQNLMTWVLTSQVPETHFIKDMKLYFEGIQLNDHFLLIAFLTVRSRYKRESNGKKKSIPSYQQLFHLTGL